MLMNAPPPPAVKTPNFCLLKETFHEYWNTAPSHSVGTWEQPPSLQHTPFLSELICHEGKVSVISQTHAARTNKESGEAAVDSCAHPHLLG